jgi:hypothetical protein
VAGDRIAFERLFRPLYDDAFRLAAAMLSDASLAEDAVQEALLKAWRKLYTFRTGEDVRPWFLTTLPTSAAPCGARGGCLCSAWRTWTCRPARTPARRTGST